MFPTLVRADDDKVDDLYRLDWQQTDLIKAQDHEEWVSKYHSQYRERLPFVPTLPEKLNAAVENARYLLNESYLVEIREQARQAATEWSQRYPFDTMVREFCLQPAAAHIEVAFYLLSDCIYDVQAHRISLDPVVRIPHLTLTLFKFWCHQTGDGVVWGRAKVDRIEQMAKYEKPDVESKLHMLVADLRHHSDELVNSGRPYTRVDG
jgi:hypothetical protein